MEMGTFVLNDYYLCSILIYIPTDLRSCMKVEVAVLGSPSLIKRMVSVDVKHH